MTPSEIERHQVTKIPGRKRKPRLTKVSSGINLIISDRVLELKERRKKLTSIIGVDVEKEGERCIDGFNRVHSSRIVFRCQNGRLIVIKNKEGTDPSTPMFFMNIFTSELFHFPSEPMPTVNSVPPIACRAANETKLLYVSEMLFADPRI